MKKPNVQGKLRNMGVDPVRELVKLIPHLPPEEQRKVWTDLLSYCFAKASRSAKADKSATSDGNGPTLTDPTSTEALLSVLRGQA